MHHTVPCRSMVHVREYAIRVSSTWRDVPYSPFSFRSGIRQSTSSWYSIMSLIHVQEPPNPISTICGESLTSMYLYSVHNMYSRRQKRSVSVPVLFCFTGNERAEKWRAVLPVPFRPFCPFCLLILAPAHAQMNPVLAEILRIDVYARRAINTRPA